MLIAALVMASDFSAYRTWTCVTPKPVDMAAAVAMLCIGPMRWDASPQNPHLKKRFKVWVNPVGRAAMAKPVKDVEEYALFPEKTRTNRPAVSFFPAGTVIVKEKFDAATTVDEAFARKKPTPLPAEPELLTIMVKGRKGSKPKTGDWSYYVTDGKLRKVDASQEARCAGCHAAQSENDFTFRNYEMKPAK